GSYPGAWTSALQIQDNTNGRYVWLSPLDNGSGNNARLLTFNTSLDIYTGNNLYAATLSNTGNTFAGAVTAPLYQDKDNTSYYLDPAGTSVVNAVTYSNLYWANNNAYGFLGANVYTD